MYLAIKEILKEKKRFSLIISIIILISYLVLFLTGLSYGLSKDNLTAIEKWEAKKIVLKKGSNSNIFSSFIDKNLIEKFKDYDYMPINIMRGVVYKNGKENLDNSLNVVLIGIENNNLKEVKLLEGKYPVNDDEIIVSNSLKEEENLKIGSTLVLSSNSKDYTITGFTEEAKFSVSSVIYTDILEIEKINNRNFNSVSAVILKDNNLLKSDDLFDVILIDDFINALPGYFAQNLTFALMIGFLILISSIVLGVFMYILTMQNQQIFAVMKIQGISNKYIFLTVLFQTLVLSLIGIFIGFIFILLTGFFLPASVPFKDNYLYYLLIILLILFTSLIGSLFSVFHIKKVDPLDILG